ncbi:outer membrane beta-barrel protein [Gluconobacter sp. LMG 1744]|uniref:Outer membrane beta-barrel protein n=1 Tax=Gluconobacter cadivus TaxID=2728101 RepID=A0ABR9YVW0_9PROT|nr:MULTISPECIES: outer membrane beta-barrel protein [Gluconobacter]MBF0888687.1 outer membrane beta-barrel protein [Gluconobacter cadivus]MBF0891974.1 outer membrane beta-barrel protein [Gluconobacter cadivus]MBS1059974.1 outer membrane beta-barrel protein [Gluconobacter sp. Dm-44]
MRLFFALEIGIASQLSLFLSGAAHAQVVTQNLSALGSAEDGLSVDAFQSDTDRRYGSQGLQYGPWAISGGASEGWGYTNNADQMMGGVPSVASVTNANLEGLLTQNRRLLDIGATVSQQYYPERKLQNQTNWTAFLRGYEKIGRHRLSYRFDHEKMTQMPSDLGAAEVNQPIPYFTEDLSLDDRIETRGRLSIIPNFDLKRFLFTDLPGDNIYLHQSYRDRLLFSEGVGVRYSLAEGSDLLLIGQGVEIRYSNNRFHLPSRDSNGFSALLGYDYEIPGPFSIRVLGGYQNRFYNVSAYKTLNTFYAELRGTWTPTRMTRVSLTVSRGISDSAFESVIGFVYTTAALDIRQVYSRNVVLHAGFQIQQGGAGQSPAIFNNTPLYQTMTSQLNANFSVGVDWALDQHFSLEASNVYRNTNASGSSRYSIDMAMISVKYQL